MNALVKHGEAVVEADGCVSSNNSREAVTRAQHADLPDSGLQRTHVVYV